MRKAFVINKFEILAIILFISFILVLNYKAAEKAQTRMTPKTPQAFLTIEKSVA